VNTWLPEAGECKCSWQSFKTKRQRDYAASQAHKKHKGYIKHVAGEFWTKKGTHYWLSIYFKEIT
jgi:hypothetical protein